MIRAVEENGEITGMCVTIDDYDYASNGDGTYEYHLYVFDYTAPTSGRQKSAYRINWARPRLTTWGFVLGLSKRS